MHQNQSGRHRKINGFNRLILFLILSLSIIEAHGSNSNNLKCIIKIEQIQAVKDLNSSLSVPKTGWENVTLPDNWEHRWNKYSGTVWYRIKWSHICPLPLHEKTPVIMALRYISMAGEIFSNGELIWKDQSLKEPLSKSFNQPRYFTLPYSTLKNNNEILIRVIGVYHQIPGLGDLKLGTLNEIKPIYKKMLWQQITSFLISAIISLIIGTFIFFIWLLNRKEKALVFFSISCFLWFFFISNLLITTPFPFASITSNARLNLFFLLWHCFYFCLFTWRFAGEKYKTLERLMIITNIVFSLSLLLISENNFINISNLVILYWAIIFMTNCLFFQWISYKKKKKEVKILALVFLSFLIITIHDLYIIFSKSDLNLLAPYSSPIITLAMSLIIAWRISDNIKQISNFNESLRLGIEKVRKDLEISLKNEYSLEIKNMRLQERLKLSHELHDGLGGSLIRSMILVEKNNILDKYYFLSILKMLKSDLRQIIDTGANLETKPPQSPIQWIAPIRHRFIQIFEEININSEWLFQESWQQQPTTQICLTLTRIAEETLTNVIKHSKAKDVIIKITQDSNNHITLKISDNGIGFNPLMVEGSMHIGLQSMQARINRIGGDFIILSESGSTHIIVKIYGTVANRDL